MHTPVPRLPLEVIAPDNVHLLKPLVVIYPNARLTDLAFRGNAEIVTVGLIDRISRWDLHTGHEMARLDLDGENETAYCVETNPDRSLIASGIAEGVLLWDVKTGATREIRQQEHRPVGLAFSPNGKLLASGDNGDYVYIWDLEKGQPIVRFEGDVPHYRQRFANLHWLDGETIAAAGNHAIYWWDVTTGQLRERLPIPTGAPFFVDVAFGQITDRLAAAAQDGVVYFWDRASGAWATWPVAPEIRLNKVAFSPDAQVLAAGSFEDGLFLWDVAQQELLARRAYPADDVVDLEFSPDGRYLAAIGWDMTIWLWGIPSDTPPAVPEGSTLILLGVGAAGLAGYVALHLRAQRRTGTM
jgi:WD40 repeat protein